LGTVAYMSPEQATDSELDARSDVYALGCVGFHALSARLPFDGSPQAILVAHVTTVPPTLRSVAPSVPAPVASVIDRCLAKDAAARWESAEALADALTRALDDVVTAERTAPSAAVAAQISEQDAMAVWQRAAQLQAEAAQRMERAMAVPAAQPEDGAPGALRVRDVEAAAVEAGISRQYVAIALAERAAVPAHDGTAVAPLDDRSDQRITRLLGTTARSVSTSRVIRATPKQTLQLIGKIFSGAPYFLRLRETINGHPLDGGILRFDVPDLYKSITDGTFGKGMAYSGSLIYRCSMIDLSVLNVSLKSRGTPARPECEVIISGDLRDGQRKNVRWSIGTMAGVGVGVTGGSLGLGAAILGGVGIAAAPALLVGALASYGSMASYRAYFRRTLRKTEEKLDEMLLAMQQELDRAALFSGERLTAPTVRLTGDALMQNLLLQAPPGE
jgi:eukaryotic-like serine/threonine-protein kinase